MLLNYRLCFALPRDRQGPGSPMKSFDIHLSFGTSDKKAALQFKHLIEEFARRQSEGEGSDIQFETAEVRENALASGLGMVGGTLQDAGDEMPASLQEIINLRDED